MRFKELLDTLHLDYCREKNPHSTIQVMWKMTLGLDLNKKQPLITLNEKTNSFPKPNDIVCGFTPHTI